MPRPVLPKLRYVFKQAVSVSVRSLGVTAVAVVTISASLTVLAAFGVVVATLADVAERMGQEVEISAYLKRGTPPGAGFALAEAVQAWPEVAAARFTSSEAALEAFRETLGGDASLLDGLPPDVLPSSVELRIAPAAWTREKVEALAARLEAREEVEEVRFGREAIEQVNAFLGFARVAAWVVGAALCLGTVLIVSNTIRLTVYARRDEIEIMILVGATPAFVRAPFVIEGALQGLLGGAVALGIVVLLQEGLRLGIERGLGQGFPVELVFSPQLGLVYLSAAGLALGLASSLAAVGRFMRE
jgi:cell division transport system permease protein